MAADERVHRNFTTGLPLHAQIGRLETLLAVKTAQIAGYEARLFDPALGILERVEAEASITRTRLDLDGLDRLLCPLRAARLAVEISSYPGAHQPGSLLVDCDSDSGEARRPLHRTPPGATVTATGIVRSVQPLAGGYARGLIVGESGWAVFYVLGFVDRLREKVMKDAAVMIRGTHELVGECPLLDVFAAQAVNGSPPPT